MSGFRKPKQTQAFLKLGIYGSAGDGKTVTASLIAEGLAIHSGKEVAFVDTEFGSAFYRQEVPARTFHPAAFDFSYLDTKSITEVNREIRLLDPNKFGVIVIDSVTHLWEACKAAYNGRTTKIGSIPMQAWGHIKRPWKNLINFILSCPQHVIICGREGSEYETDAETGELRNIGFKMRCEGETAYEPHILIRMEGVRDGKAHEKIPTAFVEKDRTGILGGKIICWPNFDTLAKPLLPLLGGSQAQIPSDDDVAAQDAEELGRLDQEKTTKSTELRQKYERAFSACQTKAEVVALSKQLTPEVKKDLIKEDLDSVRDAWDKANGAVK